MLKVVFLFESSAIWQSQITLLFHYTSAAGNPKTFIKPESGELTMSVEFHSLLEFGFYSFLYFMPISKFILALVANAGVLSYI